MSDNCDYRDNRNYHLYKIDHNNPWSFDETHFAKHFAKQEGHLGCFAVFQRGQRTVEETEGRREDRGPQRRQMVIEGKRAVEETEGSRLDRGPREDRGP